MYFKLNTRMFLYFYFLIIKNLSERELNDCMCDFLVSTSHKHVLLTHCGVSICIITPQHTTKASSLEQVTEILLIWERVQAGFYKCNLKPQHAFLKTT